MQNNSHDKLKNINSKIIKIHIYSKKIQELQTFQCFNEVIICVKITYQCKKGIILCS